MIQTVILHLLYAHKRQDLPIPTLANVSDFLSSRDMPFDDEIDAMQHFDHISTKEFFEDNPFLKIYGNYIESSFKAFNENLNNYGIFVDVIKIKKIKEELKEEAPSLIEKYSSVFRTIREIQVYYADEYKQGTLNLKMNILHLDVYLHTQKLQLVLLNVLIVILKSKEVLQAQLMLNLIFLEILM